MKRYRDTTLNTDENLLSRLVTSDELNFDDGFDGEDAEDMDDELLEEEDLIDIDAEDDIDVDEAGLEEAEMEVVE